MNKIVTIVGYLTAVAAGIMLALGLAQVTVSHVGHGIDYEVSHTGAILFGLLGTLFLTAWVQTATSWRRPKPKPLVKVILPPFWYSAALIAGAQPAPKDSHPVR